MSIQIDWVDAFAVDLCRQSTLNSGDSITTIEVLFGTTIEVLFGNAILHFTVSSVQNDEVLLSNKRRRNTIAKKWLFIPVAILLLLCCYFPTDVNAQATSKVTMYTTGDSYVDSSNPDTNFGSADRLNVTANSVLAYSYLKFDLSGIPSDANIVNATLRVYWYEKGGSVYGMPSDEIGVFLCSDNSWGEQTITWNNKPALVSSPTSVWSLSLIEYHGYQSWDITQDVKNALQSKSITEVLKFNVKHGDDGFMVFQSKEGGNGPKIDIEYISTPVATPTSTPTGTPAPTSPGPAVSTPSPTPTSTPTAPTPSPTIPEYPFIFVIPLLISVFLIVAFMRFKRKAAYKSAVYVRS